MASSSAAGEHGGGLRVAQHRPQHGPPEAAAAGRGAAAAGSSGARLRKGTRPFSTRSPSSDSSAGSTVTEPNIAMATTIIVATPIALKSPMPVKSMPGHRHDHRDAGDQDRPPRGGRGDPQRGLRVVARRPLLALAAQVEQAVVDADGQAHQQHHRVGGVAHRHRVADQRHHTGGGDEGRHRQHHRQQRGDQRAERDQQDASATGTAEYSAVLKSLPKASLSALPAGVAELLDPQLLVRAAAPWHRVQHRLHPVGGVVRRRRACRTGPARCGRPPRPPSCRTARSRRRLRPSARRPPRPPRRRRGTPRPWRMSTGRHPGR